MDLLDYNSYDLSRLEEQLEKQAPLVCDLALCRNIRWKQTVVRKYPSYGTYGLSICVDGRAMILADGMEAVLKPGSVLVFGFGNDYEVLNTDDNYTTSMLMFSQDFVKKYPNISSIAKTFHYLLDMEKRIYELEENELNSAVKYIDLLDDAISADHEMVVNYLLSAFLNSMDALSFSKLPDQARAFKSKNQQYLERFYLLLQKHFKQERNIEFYAKRMGITPKYLSKVVKDASGRSAGQWIEEYVINEAKMLLKHSDMPIVEVGYALNFSSQSFFGKYFKRCTGSTPSEFRDS